MKNTLKMFAVVVSLQLWHAAIACTYATYMHQHFVILMNFLMNRFIRLAGMIAMKETLAQLPTDHSNARNLAEGTAHSLLYRAARLPVCVVAQNHTLCK